MTPSATHPSRWLVLLVALLALAPLASAQEFPKIKLSDGFTITKVADGLQLPTGITWDDQGRMYVATAGGGLFPEQLAPIQILRVNRDGSTELIADLSGQIEPSLVGFIWHEGAFYITHRASDLTGAVSRVTMDGQLTTLFSGIIDSQSEHQINDIRVGPDGRMYVAVGPAGNAGIVGPTVAPYIAKSPMLKTTPCEDITLTGRNRLYPDFRTPQEGDSVLTGAYVPFGTATTPGQVIPGVQKCGGSILSFEPADAENTIRTEAWGFRNLIGLTWDAAGNLYGAENGYDIRERGIRDTIDASLRITLRGATGDIPWYGVPDYTAGRLPVNDAEFQPPASFQAPVFIGQTRQATKTVDFLIDHAASGLTPPTPAVVLGRHPFNSSPSKLDVAPASWGNLAGHVFIAEWGDLAPPTNPLRGGVPAGFRVVRVDPATGEVFPFVRNQMPGPASSQPPPGEDGIERPFDVRFGPDGAMYIVDYGTVNINYQMAPPYEYETESGTIWKVQASEGQRATFTVTVENVSTPGLLTTDRAMGAVPLSPGAWVTFRGEDPAFTPGEMADSGTRLIAEDGFPAPLPFITDRTELEILRDAVGSIEVGTFASPGGTPDVPALFPGETATFSFTASEGERLQIETMFVQSNDWFLAFDGGGLELFADGAPISGDVTSRIALYDAGTEIDAPPGEGPTNPPGAVQKPVQDPMATNVGTDESLPIQLARERHPGFSIPANAEVIRVTIVSSTNTAICTDPLAAPSYAGGYVLNGAGTRAFVRISVPAGGTGFTFYNTTNLIVGDPESDTESGALLGGFTRTGMTFAFDPASPSEVYFPITTAGSGTGVSFFLRVTDTCGRTVDVDPSFTLTDVEGAEALAFGLEQSQPNPVRDRAEISFTLDAPGEMSLVVYDVLGREVAVLAHGQMEAGARTVAVEASALPSGVYVYRLVSGGRQITRTLTVAR